MILTRTHRNIFVHEDRRTFESRQIKRKQEVLLGKSESVLRNFKVVPPVDPKQGIDVII